MSDLNYEAVREAMDKEPYKMNLTGQAALAVQQVVNQGIDSYLEACYVPDRGDSYKVVPGAHDMHQTTLKCVVSVESMPVLLRRLLDAEDEEANDLAETILEQLGVEH